MNPTLDQTKAELAREHRVMRWCLAACVVWLVIMVALSFSGCQSPEPFVPVPIQTGP